MLGKGSVGCGVRGGGWKGVGCYILLISGLGYLVCYLIFPGFISAVIVKASNRPYEVHASQGLKVGLYTLPMTPDLTCPRSQ